MKALSIMIGSLIAVGGAASGQTLEVAESASDATEVRSLYQGTAPGSEKWDWKEQVSMPPAGWPGGRIVRNVRQPTLTIFKPANPRLKTDTAVVIAPGGGFRWLSVDSEGYDVARYLAARGITAIVLKYRVDSTATDETAFRKEAAAFIGAVATMGRGGKAPPPPSANPQSSPRPGIADGQAAIAYVRAHASELGISPDHIGMVGFSAGGSVTLGALLSSDGQTRPNFAGLIYAPAGGPDVKWSDQTPPIFAAVAADDFLVDGALSSVASLRAAKVPVELHLYAKGGHGFGMQQQGLTSDKWIDQFAAWMNALGFMTAQP